MNYSINIAKIDQPSLPYTLEDESPEELKQLLRVEQVKAIPEATKKLCTIPDRRAYRSMSRSAVLLSSVGLNLKKEIDPFIESNAASVGIYCAVQNGPDSYFSVAKVLEHEKTDSFHKTYKRFRSPKHYLKQLPNLAPGQLGIFLNAQGPTHTYTHSRYGVLHAVQRARHDLVSKRIEVALICSAFAFEDPIALHYYKNHLQHNQVLCEGAAAILVTDSSKLPQKEELYKWEASEFYGISNPLIHYVKEYLL